MPRGRRPAPAALAKLKGRSHHKKTPGKSVTTSIGSPDMPSHIRGDAIARECWTHMRKDLVKMKVLSPKDWAALEGMCISYSRAVQADEMVRKHGVVVVKGKGLKKRVFANPAVNISKQSWAEVRRFAIEFGLTPAAATRVREVPDEQETGKAGQPPKQTAEDFIFRKRDGSTGKVIPIQRGDQ